MKKTCYYSELKIEQNELKTGPKYFSKYETLFSLIHTKCNKHWTEPIPVSGYQGKIVYIAPPKKADSGPITFKIPKKEMTEEEWNKYFEDFCFESSEEEEDEEDD